MLNNEKVFAVIPARGGSKRLPGKNILELAGKPMIAWSIEAARNSKFIDEIFVSDLTSGSLEKIELNLPKICFCRLIVFIQMAQSYRSPTHTCRHWQLD